MNIYYIDPTYVKVAVWKPLLDYLQVKAVWSFIPKTNLPPTLLKLVSPYLKNAYNGQDLLRFADYCAYWLRGHIEKHLRVMPGEDNYYFEGLGYDETSSLIDEMSDNEKKQYSLRDPVHNIQFVNDSNCLILIHLKRKIRSCGLYTYLSAPIADNEYEYTDYPEIISHISRYTLNILKKKHGSLIYTFQTAFVTFDEFFHSSYLFYIYRKGFEGDLDEWEPCNLLKNTLSYFNETMPQLYPKKEKNGKVVYTPLIRKEGVMAFIKLLAEERHQREENERLKREEDEENERMNLYDTPEDRERDYQYYRGLLIEGGIWDRDD